MMLVPYYEIKKDEVSGFIVVTDNVHVQVLFGAQHSKMALCLYELPAQISLRILTFSVGPYVLQNLFIL